MTSPANAILCEVRAPRAAQAAALAEIAVACARDVNQSLSVQTLALGGRPSSAPVLTLHLPVGLASSQHRIWCLACRLACFCPQARISVLVTGADFSAPAPARSRAPLRRSA